MIAVDESKIMGLGVKPISNTPQFCNFALSYNAIKAVSLHAGDAGLAGREHLAVVVGDAQLDAGEWEADGAGDPVAVVGV